MKKILLTTLMVAMLVLFGLGRPSANAMVFSAGELATFGSIVTLPITAPTLIDVMGAGPTLRTTGSVDFAVLYDSTSSVYSYFYQVKNVDGGSGDTIARLTVDNLGLVPLIGSGVLADGLSAVTPITSFTYKFGGDFGLNGLAVNTTSNRFYFQFKAEPSISNGYLIDGGIGSGPVVGPAIPEPTTMLLFGMGVLGLFGIGRKKA